MKNEGEIKVSLSEEALSSARPETRESLSQGREEPPLYEIPSFRLPSTYSYAFGVAYTSAPAFYYLFPILFAFFALFAFLFLPSAVELSIAFFAFAFFALLASSLFYVFLPLLMRSRLRRVQPIKARFYSDHCEFVNAVATPKEALGEVAFSVPYPNLRKIRNTESTLFILFLFQGKRSVIGIEKSAMPGGMLDFILSKKK